MPETRFAILIGNSHYPSDQRLADLRCPEQDTDGLADVLGNPAIGRFDQIHALKNRPHGEILEETLRVLKRTQKDDLVLVYFSGHGKLDEQGRLYLAVVSTQSDLLGATAVPMEQIKDFIDTCRSTRIVIILDCCFSGAAGTAFAKGSLDDHLHLMSGGRGKYIMTASTAVQVAQEKEGERYSVFTKYLIEGLQTGDADLDGNGQITVDELYQYVRTNVTQESPQEPMKWDLNAKGELVIAWNPQARGHDAQTSPIAVRARYDTIVQMLKKGEVIPFLGPEVVVNGAGTRPPIFEELAQRLADEAGVAHQADPLTLLSQKIHMLAGRGVVYDNLKTICRPQPSTFVPALTHQFLARLEQPLLILSTAYDALLEDAFDAEGKPYAVVTHMLHADNDADLGTLVVQYSHRKPAVEKCLADELVLDLGQWSVIYKIHGTFNLVDPDSEEEIDSIVISEEDYLALVRILEHPRTTIPNHLARQFKKRMFLFLGYRLSDWNFRAVVDVIQRKGNFRRMQPYAVRKAATEFECLYWQAKGVRLIDTEVAAFVRDMAGAMGMQL